MSQAKTKRNERVCVLVRGQQWTPPLPGCGCTSRIHGHCCYWKAQEMVEHGLAEWMRSVWITPKGKERTRLEMAVRLLQKRRWVPTPSRDERGTMKTAQLVP